MTQHDTATSRTFLKVTLQLCSCKIASLVNPFTSETELTSNSLLIDRSSNSSHVFPDNS